jgi:hypothetical protein
MKKIAFWVAAGAGHDGGQLSRSLALVEELPGDRDVVLVVPTNDYTRALELPAPLTLLRQPESEGWEPAGLIRSLEAHGWQDGPDLLVIDGSWAALTRPAETLRVRWPALRIAVIGGSAAGDPEVDLVIIPDPGYMPDPDSGPEARDRVLGGARYVILGRTGRPRDWSPPPSPARLLVTAGNADPFDVTGLFLRALQQCREPLFATVVLGAGFLSVSELREQIAGSSTDLRLVERVLDPRPLLTETDLALTTYGPCNLELAQMGVPTLVATQTKDDVYRAGLLEELGFLRVSGWATEIAPSEIADHVDELLGSPAALAEMSATGKQLIDGRGAARVATRLERLLRPD